MSRIRNNWLARLLLTLWMAVGLCSPSLALCVRGDGSLVAASSCRCAGCDEARPEVVSTADSANGVHAVSLSNRSCCTTVTVALATPSALRSHLPSLGSLPAVAAPPALLPTAALNSQLPVAGRILAQDTGPPRLLRSVILRS